MSREEYIKVVVKSGKDQSLRRYHPWVFSGAIKKIYGNPAEGDLVEVYDNKDEYLATGHYQNGSIAIRVLSFDQVDIDEEFWFNKIKSAYELRKTLNLAGNSHNNIYRLFFGEGDGIPGLIIDYYNGMTVMQSHSIGAYKNMSSTVNALKELYGSELTGIYNKSESTMPNNLAFEVKNGWLYGDAKNTVALENGLKFNIDWTEGQKTGFFIDQRVNRELLGRYSKDRSVLNMFCYTGGFSVYALQNQAKLVHSVDSSAKAVQLTNDNVELNYPGCSNHEAIAADAIKYLNETENQYDVIVLDPPAYAKHQNVLNNALQGYKRLNQKGFEKVSPGGIMFTFSCSQVVTKENFRKSVFAAAANARRNVRILHQLTQPEDHPVNIFHPESEYLKGLVLYVE